MEGTVSCILKHPNLHHHPWNCYIRSIKYTWTAFSQQHINQARTNKDNVKISPSLPNNNNSIDFYSQLIEVGHMNTSKPLSPSYSHDLNYLSKIIYFLIPTSELLLLPTNNNNININNNNK
jgi:hypothetical protein